MRREFSHRPLLLAAIAFAIGLAGPREPALFLFAGVVLWLGKTHAHRALCLTLLIAGVLRAPPSLAMLSDRAYVDEVAVVASVPRTAREGVTVTLDTRIGRLTAFLPLEADVSYGDSVRLMGVARPLADGTETMLLRRGIRGRVDIADIEVVRRGPALFRWGMQWRESFRQLTQRGLSEQSRSMADALCFNVDSELDPELMDGLRRTGTIHIISASGLHVGIFAIFFQWLLTVLPIPRSMRIVLLLLLLLVYMGAAGMRPPVVRAVIMAAPMLMDYWAKREADLLSAMGLAALLQLAWDPWSVFDLGLHLSFTAVLGLGLFVQFVPFTLDWGQKAKRFSIMTAHSSLVATLATAPIVAWAMGYVSIISIVANLLVAPLVLVVVPFAMAAWLVSWADPLARTLLVPVEFACQALGVVVKALGDLPFAAVDIPPFSAWWIPVCYLALLGLWRKRARPA